MAVIEKVPAVSPAIQSIKAKLAEGVQQDYKRNVKKTLLQMIKEARHVTLVDGIIDNKAVDAKDLLIIAVHPLDASLLGIFVRLIGQFITMALGIYDKRIPAPWDAQPKLPPTIIKPGG